LFSLPYVLVDNKVAGSYFNAKCLNSKTHSNNFLRLTKRIDVSFSPSINYLISLNSYTENAIGKFKTNNYFGQGFNNERIGLNKFTAAFSTGLRFRTKFGNVRLQCNSAVQPTAYIKDFAPFKLFLSSFEFGIVNPVLRF
jgi:hypothetical protein